MSIAYDDEKAHQEAQETVERINAKFLAWAQANLIGKPIADMSVGQVKATLKNIVRAELGELPGMGPRPVTTPRRR